MFIVTNKQDADTDEVPTVLGKINAENEHNRFLKEFQNFHSIYINNFEAYLKKNHINSQIWEFITMSLWFKKTQLKKYLFFMDSKFLVLHINMYIYSREVNNATQFIQTAHKIYDFPSSA